MAYNLPSLDDYNSAINARSKNRTSKSFKTIPTGVYVCELAQLALTESSKGVPQVRAKFRITEGEYKNCSLMYFQNIDTGKRLESAIYFVNSLECTPIKYDPATFANDLLDIHEESENLLFEITASLEDSGFHRLKVTDVFDK